MIYLRRLLHKIRFRRIPVLGSRAAYARWAAAYPPMPHNPFMQLEQQTLLDMMPPLAGKRVLDLGCGTGRWGRVAAEHGAVKIISVDDSMAMLRAGKPSQACQGEMSALPLPDACVDVVICGLAIGHVVTPRMWSALAEMKRVLVPGGAALLSDVHPTQAWHGAKRTFTDSEGHTLAVEHFIHSYADYHAAAKRIGLTIDDVREVSAEDGKPPVLLALKFRY